MRDKRDGPIVFDTIKKQFLGSWLNDAIDTLIEVIECADRIDDLSELSDRILKIFSGALDV